MNKATITLAAITKIFTRSNEECTILRAINGTFTQGESYAITGTSGVGKSTLLHIIAGLDTPTSGSVFFNATNLTTLPSRELSSYLNTSIGFVFQSAHMIKELSVLENIILPGLIHNKNTEALTTKAIQLLEKVGLSHKITSLPGELSGGQQQRAALARALINEPAFLIADEPTGNLDAHTSAMIINLLLECYHEWGMGLIISSHDPEVVRKMNTIFTLVDGTLLPQQTDTTLCFQQKKFSQKQYK